MGFKKMKTNLTFTDLSLLSSIEKNRAIARMEQINAIVNWSRIDHLVMTHYPVGKSATGHDAYPPLILLKCLLLQQWFKIDSDPELETQINDRISFKKFLGLSFDDPAPDHSTFSRFRKRLSKDTMRLINNDLLVQFAAKGLTINEGIAIDARLVQSASHPISTEKLKEERQKRQTPEGKLNKKGRPRTFSRDLESDWTVKNEKPHYGLKEHASVDTQYGFVLATEITPASHNDSPYLPLCVADSCHTKEPIKKVYADKGYCGEPNRGFLALNKIADGIMRKATKGTELTEYEIERNKTISKVRYVVEQYFGLSHLHNNAFRARFPRLITNAMDVLFRQTRPVECEAYSTGVAFNLRRGIRVVPA